MILLGLNYSTFQFLSFFCFLLFISFYLLVEQTFKNIKEITFKIPRS